VRHRPNERLYVGALLALINDEKLMAEYDAAVEAVIGDEDQATHILAVAQVGAVIAYITAHEKGLPERGLGLTTFAERLIDQLFIQGLTPTDLLWAGEGKVTDCSEYAAVDLIADDIRRAVINNDSAKLRDWSTRGFRRCAEYLTDEMKDIEERKRARQWQDVYSHVVGVLKPLIEGRNDRRSRLRSGRRPH